MKSNTVHPLKLLSNICFFLGFASILGSILVWLNPMDSTYESMAHAERLSLFVGLWVPTLFILSNRFDRYADKALEATPVVTTASRRPVTV